MTDEKKENSDKQKQDEKFERETREFEKEKARVLRNIEMRYWRK